jgi:hypothetical protein
MGMCQFYNNNVKGWNVLGVIMEVVWPVEEKRRLN